MGGTLEMGGFNIGSVGNVWMNGMGWLSDVLNSKLSTLASCNKNWAWNNKGVQPTYLWGGDDGVNMYVYPAGSLSVNYATSAGSAATAVQMPTAYPGGVLQTSWDGVTANFGIWNLSSGLYNLGFSQARWKTVFATSGSISTSDRRKKKDINRLADKYETFFMKLIPVSFLMKDGDSGRTHIGFISQDVEDAMYECGISDLEFAGFCKDLDFEPIIDDDGNIKNIQKYDKDGNPEYLYSLRYDEFIALNTHMIQKLYKKVAELEKSIW